MTVLGPAILDYWQTRAIERGDKELMVPKDRIFKDAAEKAKVGDILWAKECYCEVLSGPTGPQHIHEMIPGSPTGLTIPNHLKPWFHLLKKRGNQPAHGLRRGESRCTLKIFSVEPDGFRCSVHMENVDVFLCRAA